MKVYNQDEKFELSSTNEESDNNNTIKTYKGIIK